ncbi:MAG: glycosyltransferase family 2 protein [Ignavibacteriales bacterium]|nr:glycosyltransferase family 2 protein [Ignavibacteriales bacterium]
MNVDNYKIAAVIVTYNRLELLKQCLDSINKQTRKLDEIIVINNSSTDGTFEWLNEQNDLTIISQENSGGAGGFYTGIKTAYEKGYDWIWCMDDDVIPEKNTLFNLICFLSDQVDNISAVASKRIREVSQEKAIGEIICTDFSKIRHDLRYKIKIPESEIENKPRTIFAATFEGMMINKDAIHKVGFPNEKFFIWYDDLEYCIRLNQFGKIYLIPFSILIKKAINQLGIQNSKWEIKKHLYGIRNLTYIEFHCIHNQRLNRIIQILSLISYFTRFLRIVFYSSEKFYLKGRYIMQGFEQLYFGYKKKLGLIND